MNTDKLVNIMGFLLCVLLTVVGFLLGALVIIFPGLKHRQKPKHFSTEEMTEAMNLQEARPASQNGEQGAFAQDISFTGDIPSQFMDAYFEMQQGALSEQEALEKSGLTSDEFRSYKERVQSISPLPY